MAATCHVCGADGGHFMLRCRPHSSEPFFPFLESQCISRGFKVPENGTLSACRVCHAFLNQQWITFEKSKTPISKRLYWLKRFEPTGRTATSRLSDDIDDVCPDYALDAAPLATKSRSFSAQQLDYPGEEITQHGSQYAGMDFDVKIPASVVCYCCGDNIAGNSSCIVHTSHWSKSEAPYFPCILTHVPTEGAKPVDQLGRVLMCEQCTLFLVRQWQTFETDNIPIHERRYRLRPANIQNSHGSGMHVSPQKACLLCLQVPQNKNAMLVHTKARTPGEPFYPFLASISVPPGADIYRKDGIAQVCGACAETLDEQWNAHELAGTPMDKRAYQITKSGGGDSAGSAVVNYQGSESKQAKDWKYEICYLCAAQSPLVRIQRVWCGSSMDHQEGNPPEMSFPFIRQLEKPPDARAIRDDHALVCTECFKQLESQWMSFREMKIPLEEQRYVIKGNHPMIVDCRKVKKEIQDEDTSYSCYLCGMKESCRDPCRLRALPADESNAVASHHPFFPFLLDINPAEGATSMEDDKTALVCSKCEANLLSQWNMYESSSILGKTKSHLRSYLTHSFICTTCRSEVHIRDARAVNPREFPMVREVCREGNGIVLRGSGRVVICKTCKEGFGNSWKMSSHDRRNMNNDRGDPNTRRSESVIVIDSDSDGEKDGTAGHHRHRNHLYPAPDSHLPQDTHRGHSGSPIAQRTTPEARLNSQGGHHHHHPSAGTKPPPLTIVSSSSGRANRTTATVTPFSQSAANSITVTSGISANALAPARTSSFAAALRKLAKQANENDEISPQVSPGSSNRSPSSTPSNKNFHLGPSPLLAPTSTPPVVTIAPTHSVNSRLNSVDSRRDLDRYSVWRSKDSPTIQPRSRPMPSHIPKPEDNRGFQPYRSGEDLRLSSDIRHPHLTYDPAAMAATMAASYPIPPSFIPPTHLPYHAFRPEDQMERYGYLRQPFFPLPSPHLIPHPSLGLIHGLRYPTELAMHMPHLAQGVSYGGLVSSASTAERERVLQDLRERERKMEEAREAEMQLHRERSSSLSEREERLKDIRRSPPTRESSHISRMHPHTSRSSSSSSYEHSSASGPISLVKKGEDDKWATHKHTSPIRNESRHEDGRRHEDGHRHSSAHSHKDKHYQRNSHHDSSRADPDKSHIPRLFQPDRRHERDPPKEHSKSRAPPPLVSANHVTSHEYSNHRTPDSYHRSGGDTAPPPMQKAHSSISSDEGQSFSMKKAKMNNSRIPSPLNLQLHPSAKDKSASTNHKTRPLLKPPMDMDKPEREFDYHLNRFYRIQSLRAADRGALEPGEGPPVSKLDLEAQRRRELRASGIYVTSESDSDSDEEMEAKRERYRRKMRRIATRSKMPVDQSEGKIAFMGEIGLVTRIKKEEIITERIKKRRSQLGETSPIRVKKTEDTPPLTLLPAAASITTKQFKKEPDYNRKCEFLHHCRLKLSSNDKKRELESARQYVETYRAQKKRRISEKTSENGDEENKDPNSVPEESLPPGTPLAVQCGTPTIPVHVPAQVYNSTTQPQQLSSSHKTPAYTLNNHLLQTVPPLQNGLVHSTSKGINGETTPNDPEGGGGVLDSSRPKLADVNKNKKSSQFSIASFLDLSSSGKHVDAQSFAQEFHKSVLRKTQKSLANQKVGSTENVRRETFFGDQHSSSHSMSRTYSHPTSSSFQWPGVDQISEAYYRHKIDQELETSILKDQMGRLQSSNVELRTRDQKLKHRLTELAETHQSQMRVKEDIQTETQQLQRCFQGIKKTLTPP